MFKWFTEYADNKFMFNLRLSLCWFNFVFEFFNLKVDTSINLPFAWITSKLPSFINLFDCYFGSPFTRMYKNKRSIHNRVWQIQMYFTHDLETAIGISIPHTPVDHMPRAIDISILGLHLEWESSHDIHLSRGTWETRFPSDLELEEFDKEMESVRKRIFGKQAKTYLACKDEKKLQKYWDEFEDRYNQIADKPSFDEEANESIRHKV